MIFIDAFCFGFKYLLKVFYWNNRIRHMIFFIDVVLYRVEISAQRILPEDFFVVFDSY
jgi:hypothetical protein